MVSVEEELQSMEFNILQVATDKLVLKDNQTHEIVWLAQTDPKQLAKVTRFSLVNPRQPEKNIIKEQPVVIE